MILGGFDDFPSEDLSTITVGDKKPVGKAILESPRSLTLVGQHEDDLEDLEVKMSLKRAWEIVDGL